MQTAIATVFLGSTLNEKLEAISSAVFRWVEIFKNDLLSSDGTPIQVGRRMKDLGLEATTFHPFRTSKGCRHICARKPCRDLRTNLM